MLRSRSFRALVLFGILALLFPTTNASAQSGTCLQFYPDTLLFYQEICNDSMSWQGLDTQYLAVFSCDSLPVIWTVGTSDNWLSAQPDSGANSDTLMVFVDPALLPPPGVNPGPGDTVFTTGYLTIETGGSSLAPHIVPVGVGRYCASGPAELQADPNAFHPTTVADTVLTLSTYVSEVHGANVPFEISSDVDWIVPPVFITPPVTPTSIFVDVVTDGMAPGTYTGNIRLTAYPFVLPLSELELPVTLTILENGYRLAADPAQFNYNVLDTPGVIIDTLRIFEESGASVGFWAFNKTNWVYLDTMSITPLETPESIVVLIDPQLLPPGPSYDTIFVYSSDVINSPLIIPVTVTRDVGDYVVHVAPETMTKAIRPGTNGVDSLYVYEEYGRNIPFNFSSSAPWLALEPLGMPPYYTPSSLTVGFLGDGLTPGTYYDTILISSATDSMYFPPIRVPVELHVYDSVSVSATPGSFEFHINIGDTAAFAQVHVVEDHGVNVAFKIDKMLNAPWLVINTDWMWYTPADVSFNVNAAGMPRGAYSDTLRIYDPTPAPQWDDVKIPVVLFVDTAAVRLVVYPAEFDFHVEPESSVESAFGVYEATGRNVQFEAWSNAPWLSVPVPFTPWVTPDTVPFTVHSDSLPLGWYHDTIFVSHPGSVDTQYIPVTMTVDTAVAPVLVAAPTSLQLSLAAGTVDSGGVLVYELHGQNIPFTFWSQSPWLSLPADSSGTTPDTLRFIVNTSGLPPGEYLDTIGIYSAQASNEYVPVQVHLTVTSGSFYTVDTDPSYLRYYWHPGQGVVWEGLRVFETTGDTIPFNITRNIPWLVFDTSSAPPAWTPWNVYVAAIPSNDMPPGIYVDTMYVLPVDTLKLFDPVPVPVWLNIPDSGQRVVAVPDHFNFTVMAGTNLYGWGFYVYEAGGDSTYFSVQSGGGSPWLQILPDSLRMTPDSVRFNILTEGLAPGFYDDSIIVYDPTDDFPSFDQVAVPVFLQVLPDTSGFVVATDPPSLQIHASGVTDIYDSILVYEIHGYTAAYLANNASPWLTLEPYNTLPVIPQTPSFLHYLIDADSMPVGNYYDTIRVTPAVDSTLFPAVQVPVYVSIGSQSDVDSLIIPRIEVTSCCSGIQPVMVQASRPLRGLTVPVEIPPGVTINEISFAGTPVEDWDYKVSVIQPDSGYMLVVLFNTFDAVVPAGYSKIFDISFDFTDAACGSEGFIHWDTTLSWDPTRWLLFSDIDHNDVHPGFAPHPIGTTVPGYVPGDMDGDGNPDITDLTRLVSFLFLYGDPPLVMNAADVNGSCTGPNISDLTYFVSALFLGGGELRCGCLNPEGSNAPAVSSDIVVSSLYRDGITTITLESDEALTGLQLQLTGDLRGEVPENSELGDEFDMFSGYKQGTLKIGLFDWEATASIPSGEHAVLSLPGEFKITGAVVSDLRHKDHRASIAGSSGILPEAYQLHQNYPNPFNPTTTIEFDLPRTAEITLTVYNVLGQEIRELAMGQYPAGTHRVTWDGKDDLGAEVASGVYMYKLTAGSFTQSRKMMFIK